MYHVRPAIRLSEDALYGAVHGYTGLDLAQPFLCLGDGGSKINARFWQLTYMLLLNRGIYTTSDILVNMLDLGVTLLQNCNLVNTFSGLTSTAAFAFQDDILAWAQANSQETLVLSGLFTITTIQALNDAILGIYSVYLWLNHLDLRNLAYLAVKATNNGLMLYTTITTYQALAV